MAEQNRSSAEEGEASHTSWFKLFKRLDGDGSGQISYGEFAAMVRDELLVPPAELPERALKAAWLALDADASGCRARARAVGALG